MTNQDELKIEIRKLPITPLEIVFHDEEQNEIGKFFHKDGIFSFKGQANKSAQTFVKFLEKNSKEWLESERRKAVEEFKDKISDPDGTEEHPDGLDSYGRELVEEVFTSLYAEK